MSDHPGSGERAPDTDHYAWLASHGLGFRPGLAVLDLGCGSGFLCQRAVKAGARHAVGIDLLPPDVAPAGWTFATLDLEAEHWDRTVPRPDGGQGAFDLILAFDIVEHLSAPARFLAGCHALLAGGGRLVLTTPNTTSWERLLRPRSWSGATDPQHRVLFNLYSLDFLLRRLGFAPLAAKAPVRKLGPLAALAPQVGGQIFCVAGKVSETGPSASAPRT